MFKLFLVLYTAFIYFVASISPAHAPNHSKQHQFALYIMGHHDRMGDWMEAVGRNKPPSLRYSRAMEYAKMFYDLAKFHGISEANLFRVVVPYVTQECGFINTINDKDLKIKSRGLFALQTGTAKYVASLCKRYQHTLTWSDAKWDSQLVLDTRLNSDIGMEIMGYNLLEVYEGFGTGPDVPNKNVPIEEQPLDDADKVYQVMVAGPRGARENRKVNWPLFRDHQKEAVQFYEFLARGFMIGNVASRPVKGKDS